MGVPISEGEFASVLSSFTGSAFRVEAQLCYALDDERADFEKFLAGSPTPPPEMAGFRSWMGQVTQWTQEGKTISRVRVLAEPPTDYQRWLLWGAPWYAGIGEDIRYMSRSTAHQVGLPLLDWWLLDDARVVVMRFTEEGAVSGKELITGPEVATYRELRRLALQNSTVQAVAA